MVSQSYGSPSKPRSFGLSRFPSAAQKDYFQLLSWFGLCYFAFGYLDVAAVLFGLAMFFHFYFISRTSPSL